MKTAAEPDEYTAEFVRAVVPERLADLGCVGRGAVPYSWIPKNHRPASDAPVTVPQACQDGAGSPVNHG